MDALYEFPKKTEFGKVLPKNKIYEHASPRTSIKNLFVRQVDKIIWSYKLSPETTNLPSKGGIEEIEVFTILLKTGDLKEDVLITIDKVVPSPILFILSYENKYCYAAAYKRQNEADKNKWVVSSYFYGEWLYGDSKKVSLPVVLDLQALYHSLVKEIIPLKARDGESTSDLINRSDILRIKEREAERIEARLLREKQFNRKVEINASLRDIKNEITKLLQ